MKAKVLLLILPVLLTGAYLVYLFRVDSGQFKFFKVETTLTWSGGPDVKLNPASIGKLNAELNEITGRAFPGRGIHYPVVSLGKRCVEVMYLGSEEISADSQTNWNAYIVKRLPELASAQIEKKS